MGKDKQELTIYVCNNVGMEFIIHLVKIFSLSGYKVVPVFCITEQKYRLLAKSVSMKKSWLRFQMYVIYPAMVFYRGLFCTKNSVFVVSSGTFYVPYLTKLFFSFKGVKVIHVLHDLFPDALEVAGSLKLKSYISNLFGIVIVKSLKKLDGTVYMGNFLKQHTEYRWAVPNQSAVIDISPDLDLYRSETISFPESKKLIIHYGGQLGHMHDAVSIIEAIKFVLASDLAEKVEFNFYISGAQARFLEVALSEYPVKIISPVSGDVWREDIKNFHIGLVSLSPGGASVCMPSKAYAMMAGGLAIIGICPIWSDLGILINHLNAGCVINNSAYKTQEELLGDNYLTKINEKANIELIKQGFKNTLENILNTPEIIREKRANSYDGVRANFNNKTLGNQWKQFIESVIKKDHKVPEELSVNLNLINSSKLKVSIITVVLENHAFINDAIDSVLSQRYENIEYIIIDGGSKDGSMELIQSYGDKISKFISEPDKGIYDALNKGIAIATGDIIGLLHSDDFFENEDVIGGIVEEFASKNCDAVYGNLTYVDDRNKNKIVRVWKAGLYRDTSFYNGWMPPHPTFYAKAEVYKKFGAFNTSLKFAADYELLLRLILKHKIKLSYIPEYTVKMRIGGKSNRSLRNRILANIEDRKAWKINEMKPHFFTLMLKPFSKIFQYRLI